MAFASSRAYPSHAGTHLRSVMAIKESLKAVATRWRSAIVLSGVVVLALLIVGAPRADAVAPAPCTELPVQSGTGATATFTVTFSTVGDCTWTPPAGAVNLDILLLGGGGGGGAGIANALISKGGGGGGGAGQARLVLGQSPIGMTPPIVVTVGRGGTGGADPSLRGDAGQASQIGGGFLRAEGGTGGYGATESTNQGGGGGTTGNYAGGGFGGTNQGGGGGSSTLVQGGSSSPSITTPATSSGAGGAAGLLVGSLPGASGSFFAGDVSRVAGAGGGGGTSDGVAVTGGVAFDGGGAGAGASASSGFAATSGSTGSGGGGGGGAGGTSPGATTFTQGADGGSGLVIVKYQLASISPTSVTIDAYIGQPITPVTIQAYGIGGPIDYYEQTVTPGVTTTDLLPGITLTTSTGVISGTPTAAATATSFLIYGYGAAGSPDSSVTIIVDAPSVPAAPTSLVATPGDGQASVTFTPGSDHGSAILNYEYSQDNGNTWNALSPARTGSPITISGLVNGTSYQVVLRALSALGPGAASAPVLVVPQAPASPTSPDSPSPMGASTPTPNTELSSLSASRSPLDPTPPGTVAGLPSRGLEEWQAVVLVNGVEQQSTASPSVVNGYSNVKISSGGSTTEMALGMRRTIVVQGRGYEPNGEVRLFIFSDPTPLGTLPVDSAGAFHGRFMVPSVVKAGSHVLQSVGYAMDGSVLTVSMGVLLSRESGPHNTYRVAKTTVFFDALSAQLSSTAKASLKTLAKGRALSATRTVVVGYVQPSGTSHNDQTLSTLRAKTIATYLRSLGLKGTVMSRGDGVSQESGAAGRKAVVALRYVKH